MSRFLEWDRDRLIVLAEYITLQFKLEIDTVFRWACFSCEQFGKAQHASLLDEEVSIVGEFDFYRADVLCSDGRELYTPRTILVCACERVDCPFIHNKRWRLSFKRHVEAESICIIDDVLLDLEDDFDC